MGSLEEDAEKFRDLFAADARAVCSLAGHLHEHQSTCFKYAPEGSRRKPQHCRFNFTHFVVLPFTDEETGRTKLRELLLAQAKSRFCLCGPAILFRCRGVASK